MITKFKVGDNVSWNSETGIVSGTIIKIHTKNFDYKGYTHHASEDEPQYEIKSKKTDDSAYQFCREIVEQHKSNK